MCEPTTSPASGFTLIELIVVIILMAILAATAAPRFFDQNAFEGPAFAQELASAARYAQKLAVANGCPVRLVVTANSYALKRPNTFCDTTFATPADAAHPAGLTFPVNAPNGVAITGQTFPFTVQFNPRGIPTDTSNVALATVNLTVSGRTVVITAGSGYVEVQ